MKRLHSITAFLFAALLVSPTHAQIRVGLHAGADAGPDAITMGVHASAPVGQTGVYAVPSVSYGFGSQEDAAGQEFSFRSYRGSVRAVYPISLSPRNELVFAPQAGPVVYHQAFRNCTGVCSDTGFGVNVGAGVRFAAFSITAMAGIGDVPNASVLLGLSL